MWDAGELPGTLRSQRPKGSLILPWAASQFDFTEAGWPTKPILHAVKQTADGDYVRLGRSATNPKVVLHSL
jgi:hypothetical protein